METGNSKNIILTKWTGACEGDATAPTGTLHVAAAVPRLGQEGGASLTPIPPFLACTPCGGGLSLPWTLRTQLAISGTTAYSYSFAFAVSGPVVFFDGISDSVLEF